jgi:peptide/nickel transport system permease protein
VRARGLTGRYVLRRFGIFLLTIWLASTLIFIIPRLMAGDPVRAMVGKVSIESGRVGNSAALIAAWRERFGLDDSVWLQYLKFLKNSVTFDFGFSITNFPASVNELIGSALPWTLGLMLMSTIIAFVVGNLIGALMGWRATPGSVRLLLPATLAFTAVPAFMLGLLLLYIFAFTFGWLPYGDAYDHQLVPGLNLEFGWSVVQHGLLPAITIVMTNMGFWALSMRGMMVMIEGEDYMILGEAKGLRRAVLFWRYGVRNAILPQITSLALIIGGIVSGQILVEYLFGYPGVGYLLYQGILNSDYVLVQSIVFLLILATALSVFILDLAYPLLDPRISYKSEARA